MRASGAVIADRGTYASPEAANERSPTASARTWNSPTRSDPQAVPSTSGTPPNHVITTQGYRRPLRSIGHATVTQPDVSDTRSCCSARAAQITQIRIAGSLTVSSALTAQNGGAAPPRLGWQQVASAAGFTLSNREVGENAHSPAQLRSS